MARPSIVDRTESETFEFVNSAGIFLEESALAISDILPSPTACVSTLAQSGPSVGALVAAWWAVGKTPTLAARR